MVLDSLTKIQARTAILHQVEHVLSNILADFGSIAVDNCIFLILRGDVDGIVQHLDNFTAKNIQIAAIAVFALRHSFLWVKTE